MRLLLSTLGLHRLAAILLVAVVFAVATWLAIADLLPGSLRALATLYVGATLAAAGAGLLLLLTLAGPLHERLRRTITTNAAAAWTLEGELRGTTRPSFGGWSIEPDAAVGLVRALRAAPGSRVLELGPGASTEVLAGLLGRDAHIVSLEHDKDHLARLRSKLESSAQQRLEIRYAPLVKLELVDWSGEWYDPEAFEGLEAIDLLVVDGPPGPGGPKSRYPALPMVIDRLAPGALVFVDDAWRPDEQSAVERWTEDFGLLVHDLGASYVVLRVPASR
jgi:predicted O-methyltransferase YrrM